MYLTIIRCILKISNFLFIFVLSNWRSHRILSIMIHVLGSRLILLLQPHFNHFLVIFPKILLLVWILSPSCLEHCSSLPRVLLLDFRCFKLFTDCVLEISRPQLPFIRSLLLNLLSILLFLKTVVKLWFLKVLPSFSRDH